MRSKIYFYVHFILNNLLMFFRYGYFFPKFYIGKNVELKGKNNISLAENVKIFDFSILNTFPNPYGNPHRKKYSSGTIGIGSNTAVKNNVQLYTYKGSIILGENCTINPNCVFYGEGGIKIGNNVMIATGTTIVASNHVFLDSTITIRKQGVSEQGIVIDNDVWVAANCVIVDGTHIPEGVVIGANSLVRGKLESYGVYAGSPVKKIGERKL